MSKGSPNEEEIAKYLDSVTGELKGILIGHTHSDHVLDLPGFIKKTGVMSYGTQSLFNLLSAYNLEQKAIVVKGGGTYDVGPFSVCPIDSIHGKALFGKIPFPGKIEKGLKPPLRVNKYRHGGPLAWKIEVGGRVYLHLGSADFIEENLKDQKIDVLFVCSAGRQYTENFTPRLMSLIKPDVIIPFHFDDFSVPIKKGDKFPHVPGVNLAGFVDDLKSSAPWAEIVVPTPFTDLEL